MGLRISRKPEVGEVKGVYRFLVPFKMLATVQAWTAANIFLAELAAGAVPSPTLRLQWLARPLPMARDQVGSAAFR